MNAPHSRIAVRVVPVALLVTLGVGVNVPAGYATGRDAVNAWWGSPGHRAHLLEPGYRVLGLAVRVGPPTGLRTPPRSSAASGPALLLPSPPVPVRASPIGPQRHPRGARTCRS